MIQDFLQNLLKIMAVDKELEPAEDNKLKHSSGSPDIVSIDRRTEFDRLGLHFKYCVLASAHACTHTQTRECLT